jgi:C4-dicarboxylate-specific signal transduction histidine kinase
MLEADDNPLPSNLESVAEDFRRNSADLDLETVHYHRGDLILDEGVANDRLYVIVKGEVDLHRRSQAGKSIFVDTLRPGGFLGLLSFWSNANTFTYSKARTDVTCLLLTRVQFEHLVTTHPKASLSLYNLMANSMAGRYRHMVMLNIAVNHLTIQLEEDRTRLKETVQDLEQTRKQLVHKERLAMLGQLLAGIAHEINNPGTAMKNSAEDLIRELPLRFQKGNTFAAFETEAALLREGIDSAPPSSSKIRERMALLEKRFPRLPRSLLRKLQPLSEEVIDLLEPFIREAELPAQRQCLEEKLSFHTMGSNLKNIEITIGRISSLIQSLKSYGRPTHNQAELQNLSETIYNTVTVLNHRLKYFNFELDLEPVPSDAQVPSDISQILTNLIVNACDATPESGSIWLRVRVDSEATLLTLEDSGSGIPENLIDSIFEPNVTTKSAAGQFGLGLGLAISREITERYGGRLTAENREQGGARFTLSLPRDIRIL